MTMMTMPENAGALLERLDVETDVERVDTKAVALLNRSEVEAQLDAAHRHPRAVKRFLSEALTLATLTREVAESCIYTLPRAGKAIAGPSVRLAEICASAYGNLHVGARVIDVEDKVIVSQGIAWDLEKNLRVTVEVRRRITDKKGRRFDDDMITVTGNAAASIALRNAIFRVVPRAYVDTIYAKVREAAVGNAMTLADRRAEVVSRLGKIGVPIERVFARLGKVAIEDVGLEDVETLIGLGTAIKAGDLTIDAAFPPAGAAVQSAPVMDLEARLREPPAAAEPAATPAPAPAAPPSPAPGPTFDEEVLDLEKTLARAMVGKDKAAKAAALARLEKFQAAAPKPLVDRVMKFYAALVGGKREPAAAAPQETPTHDGREPPPGALQSDREPGEEG